jgi:hypothetical protein
MSSPTINPGEKDRQGHTFVPNDGRYWRMRGETDAIRNFMPLSQFAIATAYVDVYYQAYSSITVIEQLMAIDP